MAAVANLSIDQSTTFSASLTVKDAFGNPFDLTNCTIEARMARGYASTRTRVSFTSTIADDPTTGVIVLTLTNTQTAALDAPARYVYDVDVIDNDESTVTRVIEGLIVVRPNV
jgi:hypothetical protein